MFYYLTSSPIWQVNTLQARCLVADVELNINKIRIYYVWNILKFKNKPGFTHVKYLITDSATVTIIQFSFFKHRVIKVSFKYLDLNLYTYCFHMYVLYIHMYQNNFIHTYISMNNNFHTIAMGDIAQWLANDANDWGAMGSTPGRSFPIIAC